MSAEIQTFVFFDIETTGLPWQERNRTKIIEISLVAANRNDIILCTKGELPPVIKLTTLLNPQRSIHPQVSTLTGLTNNMVRSAPTFKQKFDDINLFFMSLKQPVCLVAHNGNVFDYKILLAECNDARVCLPIHLLCVDSIVGFRRVLKEINTNDVEENTDEWPELQISSEDWNEIDELCNSLSDVSTEDVQSKKRGRKKISKKTITNKQDKKQSYTLSSLYEKFLNKKPIGAHRAENDCVMLLECFIACNSIMEWADNNCKLLNTVTPLNRYYKTKI